MQVSNLSCAGLAMQKLIPFDIEVALKQHNGTYFVDPK